MKGFNSDSLAVIKMLEKSRNREKQTKAEQMPKEKKKGKYGGGAQVSKGEIYMKDLMDKLGIKYQAQPSFFLYGSKMAKGKSLVTKHRAAREMYYKPDFVLERSNGTKVIVDIKGSEATVTEAHRLRWNMLQTRFIMDGLENEYEMVEVMYGSHMKEIEAFVYQFYADSKK